MEGITDKIIMTGVVTLLALSGLMGIILLNYVKGVMKKIDDVSHIAPMLERVDKLVEKVDKIVNKLALAEQKTDLELIAVKKRLDILEALVEKLRGVN